MSHRPYAVNPGSLRVRTETRQDGTEYFYGAIEAAWFRRRSGFTVACLGRLWDYQDERPSNAEQFLANHRDGRYGGSAIARWDGSNLWAPEMRKAKQDQCFELLEPMLANFPAVPPGYDGWWTFKENAA